MVVATFVPVIEASKEDDNIILDKILYIYYPLRFYKDKKNKIQALINFSSKINIMILVYASKLDHKICQTNIKVQKIDSSTFKMFDMVLASFLIKNKLGKA